MNPFAGLPIMFPSNWFTESLDGDRDLPLCNLPVLIGREGEDWFDCRLIIQRKYEEIDEVSRLRN